MTANTTPKALKLDSRAAARVARFYPLVYKSDVLKGEDFSFASGSESIFLDHHGKPVAKGFVNQASTLLGRILTWDVNEQIDRAFFVRRFQQAKNLRDALYQKPFYRLIHAEGDQMPGLIIDRYGDTVVLQVNTAGFEQYQNEIIGALEDVIAPSVIVLKNTSAVREREGLETNVSVVKGVLALDSLIEIEENGTKFMVDVIGGQKTGWFFDQRDNRAWFGGLAKGKTFLDMFAHTGGFGVTAGKMGAARVTFVDSSGEALKLAQKNCELNGIGGISEFIDAKAYPWLEKAAAEGKTFDCVCLDPPAFIKSRKDAGSGMRGYHKLALLGSKVVAKGGWMFFASCSHHAPIDELLSEIAQAIAKTGRRAQLVKTSGTGADHPVNPLVPETSYLKAFTFRFLD